MVSIITNTINTIKIMIYSTYFFSGEASEFISDVLSAVRQKGVRRNQISQILPTTNIARFVLLSCNTCFEIRPFAISPTNYGLFYKFFSGEASEFISNIYALTNLTWNYHILGTRSHYVILYFFEVLLSQPCEFY